MDVAKAVPLTQACLAEEGGTTRKSAWALSKYQPLLYVDDNRAPHDQGGRNRLVERFRLTLPDQHPGVTGRTSSLCDRQVCTQAAKKEAASALRWQWPSAIPRLRRRRM